MKTLKLRSLILLVLVCTLMSSCVTLQQPLPGRLWGDWAFVETGTIINGSGQQLYNYRNVCSKNSDQLRFSSDGKMNLRWYDDHCAIQQYLIGRYHVEGSRIKVDLAPNSPYQDSPFPPITEFRIIQSTATTLQLEEIPDAYMQEKYQGKPSGPEVMVFVFRKLE